MQWNCGLNQGESICSLHLNNVTVVFASSYETAIIAPFKDLKPLREEQNNITF